MERKELYAIKFDVYINGNHLVRIFGDGVLIST